MSSSGSVERHHQTETIYSRIPSHNKHVVIYDNCTTHQPTVRPHPTEYSRETNTPLSIQTIEGEQADYDDIPPLGIFDDEDDEDARSFSRSQKDLNAWLLFSGLLALVVTLFNISFAIPPFQRSTPTKQLITTQLHKYLREASEGIPVQSSDILNFTHLVMDAREPMLAREMRDIWVPALCHFSLALALIGAMLTLQIKQQMMSCTLSVFPLLPADPTPRSLRAAAVRFTEFKKSRKETVHKTEMAQRVVPPIMYGALGSFACGVLVKLGTIAYFQLF